MKSISKQKFNRTKLNASSSHRTRFSGALILKDGAILAPTPRLTAWTWHPPSHAPILCIPPSFPSPLGFHQRTQRASCGEAETQEELGQMPGQLWPVAGRTGRVAGDTGYIALGHVLLGRASLERGKTRLRAQEGLSSELGPTPGLRGSSTCSLQTSQADDLCL